MPPGLLRLVAHTLDAAPTTPLPSRFWAAGFSFSRATLIHEVGKAPHSLELHTWGSTPGAPHLGLHTWVTGKLHRQSL